MKTTLALLSLFFTNAVAAALIAEFAGVALPSSLDPSHAFAAFAVSVIIMTAFADYAAPQGLGSSSRRTSAMRAPGASASQKSEHPLAA